MELFKGQKVADIPFGSVVEVSGTDLMKPAFTKLSAANILSAPVYDEAEKKYLGFFDLSDALTMIFTLDMIVSVIPDEWIDKSNAAKMAKENDTDSLKVGDIFENNESSQDEIFEKRAPFLPCTEDSSMEVVIRTLAKNARRVPVMNKDGRIRKIISQSLVTQLLNDALLEKEKAGVAIPAIFSKSISTIKECAPKEVISVDTSDTTREAFLKILENNISACAILDEDGKLLSSISTKDIRLFKSMEEVIQQRIDQVDGKPSLMELPCTEFVQKIREAYETKGQSHAAAVVVTPDTTLRALIGKLAATKMHRVFVVDKERTPLGVVSVSDIARILVSES
uniref:CBS domain-containing protein n=1 Tax=Aplanochytrium stocchinoi TaxID=215587 RepID=A0A7S3V0B1_9STRA|mmetsp:Transcript_19443/g.23691  ORF Transcript_19443/g.23691 Transcript_19443/m.23691 type:complete len:339 (+) Transcript_19443:144-1160(+)|eukprot:CAMPEP_0204829720 /NCGR_PEP_ID=MMETSP1346-20131115/8023_1 /ASSEMBLY_ACC=CAM_ASM_000771 /TAXON_ID=215587 /ORGANISM="Aplanochytrium stocchinoi, Strain GSBS06" /LENGTH=338 /DNA_ID=CAMNT_0051959741 /DNA_START=77 /DNA_END=1093 /DNA_ORIENTATION=+